MWLMSNSSRVSRTWSAFSCFMPPSAAAPKITRLLSCPVLPKALTGITVHLDCLAVSEPLPYRRVLRSASFASSAIADSAGIRQYWMAPKWNDGSGATQASSGRGDSSVERNRSFCTSFSAPPRAMGRSGRNPVDWLNAAMILVGMGPVDALHTRTGKLFASFCAPYSGLAIMGVAGLLVAPIAHRFLHKFHLPED